ncbi:GYD domain-containing protein [Pseudarthrobacter sp. N5]|uniref:GYD domain-containing protein n=1 Tax=Pseudarthrobacter sp. N5 TaxID=3418416 RepID=UPI003CECA607
MTKYLFEANYVGEGIKGLMREGGTKRRDAVVEALKSVDGSVECFYYAFGETDVLGPSRSRIRPTPPHCRSRANSS